MKRFKVFILGILAGIAISLGSLAYLSCSIKEIGSIFFALGLLLVCTFSFKLYTGQIGKVFENKKSFLLDLLLMYLGNAVGSISSGLLLSLTVTEEKYAGIYATGLSKIFTFTSDIGSPWYTLFISSIFCGILVYLGVEIFNKAKHPVIGVTGLVLCVAVFVISSCSHCIANMFYVSISKVILDYPIETILSLLLVTLGNSIGAIFIWFLMKLCKSEEK